MLRRRLLALGAAAAVGATARRALADSHAGAVYQSQRQAFRVTPLARDLSHPWGLAFLPDGALLITERSGRLRLVRGAQAAILPGAPPVQARAQGGLLDVALHPDFARNRLVYLSYAAAMPEGAVTAIARARFSPNGLTNLERIFEATPRQSGGFHFGCRLAFGRDGKLYATTGDRYDGRERAQSLADLRGKVVRLNDDGTAPRDNPFVGRDGARPEILSYGHRNAQGLAVHPASGAIWLHEHGPRGGDEVNIIRAGANYGWPRATHGIDYSGAIISEHRSLPGMVDPAHVWTPSIAPSGMAFCTGDAYPGWRGSLFVGALLARCLVRLDVQGERIAAEERLLTNAVGRVRDVRQGPDGRLYLLTDAADGALLRLDPA
jgi:glucose/arabinose dehydrogenase